MGSILDLIGSFIIGGLLLMMILSVNNNASQFAIENGQQLSAQENLAELAGEIDYYFRKIGYHVPIHSASILTCDSMSISFQADVDNNGSVDTVAYSVSIPGLMRGTINPNDRKLIRQIGSSPVTNSLGLTDFKLRYFDNTGNPTLTTTAIKSIEISLRVESPFPIDENYAQCTWKTRLYPINLQ
jgi:hypothetical protein